MNYLLQPKKYKSIMTDEGSVAIMDKTVTFFETMGKTKLTEDFNKKVWYREFIDFLAAALRGRAFRGHLEARVEDASDGCEFSHRAFESVSRELRVQRRESLSMRHLRAVPPDLHAQTVGERDTG